MSDVVTNADGTPRLINCKLYIPAVGKTVSMDLPSRVALEDIRPSISKFLNAPLFAKRLIFHYLNAKKDLLPLEGDKPLCEQTEIIDFKRTPAEIEVKIEHAGA
jgi:hypothetical protein